ncbi:MAG: TetR family transcriptional regulator [Pararhodobacter sp.]
MARARNASADILEAARAVIGRDGPGRLTIERVAAEVGMSKAGVLYNFPSKVRLVEALLAQMIADFEASVAESRAALADRPNPTLRALIAAFDRFETIDPDVSMAIMAAAAEDPGLLAPLNRMLSGHLDQVLAETADHGTAVLVLAALDGLKFQHLMRMPPTDPALRAAALARIRTLVNEMDGPK